MRQYSYLLGLCFGVAFAVLAINGCGSSGSSNNNTTATAACPGGQIFYPAAGTCVQACGDGVTMGYVNGTCQSINGAATGYGGYGAGTGTTIPCPIPGLGQGVQTAIGCGLLVNNAGNGQCMASVNGQLAACTLSTYGGYGGGGYPPGYGYPPPGYGGYQQPYYGGNPYYNQRYFGYRAQPAH